MKKKIYVVYTGGTICCAVENGMRGCARESAFALPHFYAKSASFCRDDVEFFGGEEDYFGILSENMSIPAWNRLTEHLRWLLSSEEKYDGILLAHGTDTLSYTAALLSRLLEGCATPIILVSANAPIRTADGAPNPLSNGNANFRAAVECIYRGISPGVYAAYRNSDGEIYLHNGAHLEGCRNYSEDFYSKDPLCITDTEHCPLPQAPQKERTLPLLLQYTAPLKDCVLKITPYPGLHYGRISTEGVGCVLHGTYHSGTACVSPLPPKVPTQKEEETKKQQEESPYSLLSFAAACRLRGVDLYLSPATPAEERESYATVPLLQNACGAEHFLYGETEEWVYASLLISYSYGFSEAERFRFLHGEAP